MTAEPIDVESTERGAELVPAPRSLATVVSPTTPMGEWNVIVAQADMLSQAEIVPVAYRRKPANVIAAALSGRTFGWDVMASMRNGNVIEGTYAIKPEAQLGLVRAAGHSVSGSTEDLKASVTGRRADNGDEMTVTWTIDRAVRAGLCTLKDGMPYSRSRNGNKLPWEQYPEAMLWARAVSELCRQLFSDVTLGLSYTVDEVTGGAFSEDDTGEVHQEAAVLPPPDGWASWDECNDAHDAYIERWKLADDNVRRKMTGYVRESGYGRPMTKPQLDEVEAQLDVEIGAPAEHVKPEPPAEVAAADTPTDAAVEPPAAVQQQDVERASEAAPAAGAQSPGADDGGSAPASPVDATGDGDTDLDPAPESVSPPPEVERSTQGQRTRLAIELKKLWPTDPESGLARGAVVDLITRGRTRSAVDLYADEADMAITAAKLLVKGNLGFGVFDPPESDEATLLPNPIDVPTDQQIPTLLATMPQGGDYKVGEAFLLSLGEFLGVGTEGGGRL